MNCICLHRNIILRGDRKSMDKNQNIKPAPFLGYLSNNIECSLCHHKVCILFTYTKLLVPHLLLTLIYISFGNS